MTIDEAMDVIQERLDLNERGEAEMRALLEDVARTAVENSNPPYSWSMSSAKEETIAQEARKHLPKLTKEEWDALGEWSPL